jgi:hypothetical protein
MDATDQSDDIAAIRAIVARQFASLSWGREKPPAWAAFEADFHADAALYGAARPAQAQSPASFVARMQGLAGSTLRTFDEVVLGSEVRVFGNIALAVAACETVENETETNRNVEMMLLVKEAGHWLIVAQAWDKADTLRPIPADLLMGQPA